MKNLIMNKFFNIENENIEGRNHLPYGAVELVLKKKIGSANLALTFANECECELWYIGTLNEELYDIELTYLFDIEQDKPLKIEQINDLINNISKTNFNK